MMIGLRDAYMISYPSTLLSKKAPDSFVGNPPPVFPSLNLYLLSRSLSFFLKEGIKTHLASQFPPPTERRFTRGGWAVPGPDLEARQSGLEMGVPATGCPLPCCLWVSGSSVVCSRGTPGSRELTSCVFAASCLAALVNSCWFSQSGGAPEDDGSAEKVGPQAARTVPGLRSFLWSVSERRKQGGRPPLLRALGRTLSEGL